MNVCRVLSLKKYDFILNFKVTFLAAKPVGYDFKLNFIVIFLAKPVGKLLYRECPIYYAWLVASGEIGIYIL